MIKAFIVPKRGDGFNDYMNTYSYTESVGIFLRRIYDGKEAEQGAEVIAKLGRSISQKMNVETNEDEDARPRWCDARRRMSGTRREA